MNISCLWIRLPITTETGLGKFPAHRMKVGPAVIRSEGAVERFNAMDAKDFLNRLTDLLYDESMAFSSTDKDGMKEVIEQIEERVSQLGDKNKDGVGGQEMLSYVVIDQRYDKIPG